MLDWLFSFRGEIGRVRYLAGFSLLLVMTIVVMVAATLLGAAAAPLRSPLLTTGLAVVLAALAYWSTMALAARRLRDIGLNPWLVLGGLFLLGVAERFLPFGLPDLAWLEPMATPVSGLIGSLVLAGMLLWPGKDADADLAAFVPVAIAGVLVGVAGLGLAFDPLQPRACPAIGAASPSLDCASHGLVGRLYAGRLLVRANARLDAHDPKAALALIDRAIALRPGFTYAYNSAGIAHDQLGDDAKALAAYDQALALQPAYVNGLINRARLLDKLGHRDRALVDLRAIQRYAPDNATARAWVAYITGGAKP